MNICIIGCGSMGTALTEAASETEAIKAIYLYDVIREAGLSLASRFSKATFIDNPEDCFDDIHLLIEAASHAAVEQFVPAALEKGIDVIVMSVGAFGDEQLYSECVEMGRKSGARLLIPSGAVAGVDGIVSASSGRIDEIKLTTVKHPMSLKNIQYLQEKGIDIESLTERTVIFEGTARDVVKAFPRNVNVAATISLAGIGFDRTHVTVIADPGIKRTEHHIEVKGEAGVIKSMVQNIPDEKNPGTSHLAMLSAISIMKTVASGVWIV